MPLRALVTRWRIALPGIECDLLGRGVRSVDAMLGSPHVYNAQKRRAFLDPYDGTRISGAAVPAGVCTVKATLSGYISYRLIEPHGNLSSWFRTGRGAACAGGDMWI